MIPKKYNTENGMYTTIPPTLETPTTEIEKHTHIDTTTQEIEEYEKQQLFEQILEEETYFEKLIETEPQKEAHT